MEKIKLAFIGGGLNSAVGYTHFSATRIDNLFKIESGCFSRNHTINLETAKYWDVPRVYFDWLTLLENEVSQVDAVVVITPTNNHYEIIMKALEMGYSVIAEKPLASNLKEGTDIAKRVEQNRSFLAVTYNYTGYPMLRELQNMIQDDKLGKITNINIEMPQEGFARLLNGYKPEPQSWRLMDGKISGISLDLGTHLQNIVYFLTNENPKELVADEASFGWFPQIVDNVSCIARYKSCMRVQMWYGKSSIGHRNGLRVRVYGSKGSAEWFQMQPEELLISTINGDRIIIDRASSNINVSNMSRYNRFKSGHPAGFIEAFGNLYFDIAVKLKQFKIDKNHNIDWPYNAFQSTIGLEVFEAVRQSSLENKWIEINGVKIADI